MLNEMSEKGKCHIISLILRIQKQDKTKINEQTKQNRSRLIDAENKQLVASGERGRSWAKSVKGIKRYKLVVIK